MTGRFFICSDLGSFLHVKAQSIIYFHYELLSRQFKHVFPDSTRRSDAEAGDDNQIQVALVFQYLFSYGKKCRREAVVELGDCE